jgi:hypothetical protein
LTSMELEFIAGPRDYRQNDASDDTKR